jgi:hypothetical protein
LAAAANGAHGLFGFLGWVLPAVSARRCGVHDRSAMFVTRYGSPLVALNAVRCVSRPNLLADNASGVSAGIANEFNAMRVLFSINARTISK